MARGAVESWLLRYKRCRLTLPSSGLAPAAQAWPLFHSGPSPRRLREPLRSNVKAHMNWILPFAAVVFAWLAYDAWKIAAPAAEVPYSVTAKGLGQSVDGVPLQEQERRKNWNSRYGLGDLSQEV